LKIRSTGSLVVFQPFFVPLFLLAVSMTAFFLGPYCGLRVAHRPVLRGILLEVSHDMHRFYPSHLEGLRPDVFVASLTCPGLGCSLVFGPT